MKLASSAAISIDRQKGAVLFETAYVLPLLIGIVLLTVEVVGYALNSLAANDVLSDVHTSILSEVAEVSDLPAGEDLDPSVQFASCNSGKVVLQTGNNSAINNIVKTALSSKNISFIASDPGKTSIAKSSVSGFDVYVIKFQGTANTLVIPSLFSKLLPINVDTVISIKDNCES